MPELNQPGAPGTLLVSVPIPTPMTQQQPAAQQPVQVAAPQPQVRQLPDDAYFKPAQGPPLMILPHGPVGGSKQKMSRGEPVRMTAFRAPAGGLVSRGIFYQGGKTLPEEATQPAPVPVPAPNAKLSAGEQPADPMEGKTLFFVGRKPVKMGRDGKPIKFSASPEDHGQFLNGVLSSGADQTTPSLAYADFNEEHGHPAIAEVIRHHQDQLHKDRTHTEAFGDYQAPFPRSSPHWHFAALTGTGNKYIRVFRTFRDQDSMCHEMSWHAWLPTSHAQDLLHRLAAEGHEPLGGEALNAAKAVRTAPEKFARPGDDLLREAERPLHHVGASSPNVDSLRYDQAKAAKSGGTQPDHRAVIKRALAAAGVADAAVDTHDAVGDWAPEGQRPGAENSVLHVVHAPMTPEQTLQAAAHIGLNANQYSVLTFRPEKGGQDLLHRAFLPGITAEQLRRILDRLDVPFRTIVKPNDPDGVPGHHLVVANLGGDPEKAAVLDRLAKKFKSVLHTTAGVGAFPGADSSRTAARRVYRQILGQPVRPPEPAGERTKSVFARLAGVKVRLDKGKPGRGPAGLGETRYQPKDLPGYAEDKRAGGKPVGSANLKAAVEDTPATPAARNRAVRGLAGKAGVPLPEGSYAGNQREEKSEDVAKALQGFSLAVTGEPLDYKSLAARHGEHKAARMVVAHALVNGIDEATAQLQAGKHDSGINWYTNDLVRMESSLIALFGKKQPDGSYAGPFGRTDPKTGRPAGPDTHHMTLFKALLAPHSYGNNPDRNFDGAMRAYLLALHHAKGDFDEAWKYLPEHSGLDHRTDAFHPSLTHPDAQVKKGRFKFFPGRPASLAAAMKYIRGLARDYGTEGAAAFLSRPQPIRDVRAADQRYTGSPTPLDYFPREFSGAVRPEEAHPGVFAFGPKGGAFAMNLMRRPNYITKDLWFSRTWNRLMGTLLDQKGDIVDAPRGPQERHLMDRFVDEASRRLDVSPSEFQAVLWFYEQSLWRAFRAKAESGSFATAAEAWHDPARRKKFPAGTLFESFPGYRPAEDLFGDRTAGSYDPVELPKIGPDLESEDGKRRAAAVELAAGLKPKKFARDDDDLGSRLLDYAEVFGELRGEARRLKAAGRMPPFSRLAAVLVGLSRQAHHRMARQGSPVKFAAGRHGTPEFNPPPEPGNDPASRDGDILWKYHRGLVDEQGKPRTPANERVARRRHAIYHPTQVATFSPSGVPENQPPNGIDANAPWMLAGQGGGRDRHRLTAAEELIGQTVPAEHVLLDTARGMNWSELHPVVRSNLAFIQPLQQLMYHAAKGDPYRIYAAAVASGNRHAIPLLVQTLRQRDNPAGWWDGWKSLHRHLEVYNSNAATHHGGPEDVYMRLMNIARATQPESGDPDGHSQLVRAAFDAVKDVPTTDSSHWMPWQVLADHMQDHGLDHYANLVRAELANVVPGLLAKPKGRRRFAKPGAPVKLARVPGEQVHSRFLAHGAAAHAGRVMQAILEGHPDPRYLTEDVAGVARHALTTGDTASLPILYDALHDAGHPAVGWLNWQEAPRKIAIDEHYRDALRRFATHMPFYDHENGRLPLEDEDDLFHRAHTELGFWLRSGHTPQYRHSYFPFLQNLMGEFKNYSRADVHDAVERWRANTIDYNCTVDRDDDDDRYHSPAETAANRKRSRARVHHEATHSYDELRPNDHHDVIRVKKYF